MWVNHHKNSHTNSTTINLLYLYNTTFCFRIGLNNATNTKNRWSKGNFKWNTLKATLTVMPRLHLVHVAWLQVLSIHLYPLLSLVGVAVYIGLSCISDKIVVMANAAYGDIYPLVSTKYPDTSCSSGILVSGYMYLVQTRLNIAGSHAGRSTLYAFS